MAGIVNAVLILLFLLSSTVIKCEYDVEKAVGPIVSCSGSMRPMSEMIKNCYHRCMMDPEPAGRESISIYRVREDSKGPTVLECAKIRQSQIFTQTWTFATVKSQVSHEYLPVTTAECEEAIKANCPDRECNHREKDELEEEYHYASDTIKTSTTISLLSMPSSLQIDNSVWKISPLTAKSYVPMDSGGLKEDGKIYTWDSSYKLVECPFESVKTYACDMYKGSDRKKYYLCAGGRFSVTASSVDESGFSAICTRQMRSVEGFIYSREQMDVNDHSHSRLAITELQSMTADTNYLRRKVQQITTHLDSEICHNQCEILSLESRVNSRETAILRLGLSYYKAYRNGSAQHCFTLHGCKLTVPKIFCGNPPRIGVTCTENNGLWDPTTVELVRGGVCLKPDEQEVLKVSLGNRLYSVDDNLMIHLNKSDDHGIYSTTFSDLHQSDVQFKIEELDQMKPVWSLQKTGKGGVSRTSTSDTKINSPSFTVGTTVLEAWNGVKMGVDTVEHILGGTVIFLAVSVSAAIAWKVWLAVPKKKTYKPVISKQYVSSSARALPQIEAAWT